MTGSNWLAEYRARIGRRGVSESVLLESGDTGCFCGKVTDMCLKSVRFF
jgi:hypothetical protein